MREIEGATVTNGKAATPDLIYIVITPVSEIGIMNRESKDDTLHLLICNRHMINQHSTVHMKSYLHGEKV